MSSYAASQPVVDDSVGVAPRAPSVADYLDELPLNRQHILVFIVSSFGFFFDAIDLQVLGLAAPSIAREWNLAQGQIGWLFSLTAFGMLLGSYTFGTLSDYIGRRRCFQLTIAVFAVGSGLCFFAENTWQLGALRVLTGFGIGGFIPVDTALMSEFMPARRRGLMMGLWNLSFSVGYIVSAKIAAFVVPNYGWRPLFLVGVVPAIMIVVVRWVIPESPRFSLSRGRVDEARRAVLWISGRRVLPAELDGAFTARSMPERGKVSVAELFSPEYRSRTAYSWILWFFLMFCYLGLLPWLPTLLGRHRDIPLDVMFGIVAIFSACGILGRVVVACLVDRLGRRTLIVTFGVAAMAAAVLFGRQTGAVELWWSACILGFCLDGLLGAAATITPELYPTRARSTGIGWAQSMGRVGAILAPLAISAILVSGVEWVFNMFACALAFVVLATALFKVETARKSLEQASGEVA